MPIYHREGEIPKKRHTQFRRPDGKLYHEQLFGVRGFSGMQSLLYRINPPTNVHKVKVFAQAKPKVADLKDGLKHRHLMLGKAKPKGDPISGRSVQLLNNDLALAVCLPEKHMDYFFANSHCDEIIFVHEGEGTFASMFGVLSYLPGDYIVIPKGTIYQLRPNVGAPTRYFIIETPGNIDLPERYRNDYGQLLEHSPYCARDFRLPQIVDVHDERGDFVVRTKDRENYVDYHWGHHPFDVVGFDGYLYPYIFNINDFEPITGRIHQPPPVHQTFAGQNFVVCSFVPRLFDYHPEAIAVPYNHSNLQTDEVLYYVSGDFMSRKGINAASLTLHPGGIAHGPHPGTVEASLGAAKTEEVAVMIDAFSPLTLSEEALAFEDKDYMYSWKLPI